MEDPSSAFSFYTCFFDLETAFMILAANPPQMTITPTTIIAIALPDMLAYLLIAISIRFGMPAFESEGYSCQDGKCRYKPSTVKDESI